MIQVYSSAPLKLSGVFPDIRVSRAAQITLGVGASLIVGAGMFFAVRALKRR